MADIFLGVDPGSSSGAIAGIDPEGKVWFAEDSAGLTAEVYSTFREHVILPQHNVICAGLEKVHSMPKQGVSSSFKFGENFGVWQGILLAQRIPFHLFSPQSWVKGILKASGVGNDGSLEYCRRKYPDVELGRKKDHGKADAICLADWARKQHA